VDTRSLLDRLYAHFLTLRSIGRVYLPFRPGPLYAPPAPSPPPPPDDAEAESVQVNSETTDVFYDDLGNQFVLRPRFAATERPRTFLFDFFLFDALGTADDQARAFVFALSLGLGLAAAGWVALGRRARGRRPGSHQELPDSAITALITQARRVDALL
jgi:hypothetical protein